MSLLSHTRKPEWQLSEKETASGRLKYAVANTAQFHGIKAQIIEKLFIDKNENGIEELTVILGASLLKPMPGIIYAFDENEDETIDGYGHDQNKDGQIDKYY